MTDVPRYDITVHRGEDWTETFTLYDDNDQPVVMTGWDANLDIKAFYSGSPIVQLSTAGSTITIDEANGTITPSLSASACAVVPLERGIYDLKIDTGTTIKYLVRGDFVINPRVTE